MVKLYNISECKLTLYGSFMRLMFKVHFLRCGPRDYEIEVCLKFIFLELLKVWTKRLPPIGTPRFYEIELV